MQLACFLSLRCVVILLRLLLMLHRERLTGGRIALLMKIFFSRSPKFSIALSCLGESGGSDFKIGAQVAPEEFVFDQHVTRIDPLSRVQGKTYIYLYIYRYIHMYRYMYIYILYIYIYGQDRVPTNIVGFYFGCPCKQSETGSHPTPPQKKKKKLKLKKETPKWR